ncbi:MAG: hypothetical protein RMK20_15375 [Verrucomicrobiales bacterium]|nr:hypothetical protein [Verrucomicrobiales bacterium]
MKLEEQARVETLAARQGDVPHVSGLLRRLARISGAGERVADWLVKVAIERGASHYQRQLNASLPPDVPAASDEEIGVALCLGELPYDLDRIRIAAQLLSSRRIDPVRLCRLAVQERCEPVLLHIAELAARFAPQAEPWDYVRKHLPPRAVPRSDALPHWSRLVSYGPVSEATGAPRADWLVRRE